MENEYTMLPIYLEPIPVGYRNTPKYTLIPNFEAKVRIATGEVVEIIPIKKDEIHA